MFNILIKLLLTFNQVGYFLHLTDIHYDPYYTEGTPVNCLREKPGLKCCKKFSIPIKPFKKANKWGDKKCDTSFLFINKSFDWIKSNINNIDFILYTGDSVGHNDISQSIKTNINSINKINGLLKFYFNDIKIYYSIGNHDTYPVDQTQHNINNIFLNNFANIWSDSLNNISINDTKTGGFYFAKVNFNNYIINFNSLLYDNKNLFKNDNIQLKQYQFVWFENTLEYIKNNGGFVWIINHICPINKDNIYYNKFIEIVSKYKKIIKYNFYGHIHNDRFILLKNNINNIVGFCSIPSSLMLDNQESSFRIYKYNKYNFDILDYYQYTSNITKIINTNKMHFQKEYSFNSEYNMNGLNLLNWIKLYNTINNSDVILNQYYKHLSPGENNSNCSALCKNKILNDILS